MENFSNKFIYNVISNFDSADHINIRNFKNSLIKEQATNLDMPKYSVIGVVEKIEVVSIKPSASVVRWAITITDGIDDILFTTTPITIENPIKEGDIVEVILNPFVDEVISKNKVNKVNKVTEPRKSLSTVQKDNQALTDILKFNDSIFYSLKKIIPSSSDDINVTVLTSIYDLVDELEKS